MTVTDIMFALIQAEVKQTNISDEIFDTLNDDTLFALYKLSNSHDIAHFIGMALSPKYDHINEALFKKFQDKVIVAIYRYERIKYELDHICDLLETAGIQFVPLKGAVMREYYPEPWMRTSCDIDILVHKTDVEKVASILVNSQKYLRNEKTSHDISLFSPNGVHLELHYDLVEDGLANKASNVLTTVWNVAIPCSNKKYRYEMTDEMFYFYHVAHMAKHFENGGCGIRPFIDLWILDAMNTKNQHKRDQLLMQGELLAFANVARHLSKVWFDNDRHDTISQQMEEFILHGGVYGVIDNRILLQQQMKGGRFKYILLRIFMPYNELKLKYPILQKHKWLMPIMQLRRWLNLIRPSSLKRSWCEAKVKAVVSKDETKSIQVFLQNIGLNYK